MDAPFGRIVTAVITPFSETGDVDYAVFRELLNYLIDHGSDGVVVCGTTGESPTLSDDEKVQLFRVAVEESAGRAAIIAGTGSNDTARTVELSQRACDAGVDGLLVVTPYYNKPPREGLIRHFTAVSRASTVPVIVYNVPSRVVTNLDPELLAELGQLSNVVAVKQANPDLVETSELRALAPDLAIYAGNDDQLLPIMRLGGVGGICVASHVVGREMAQIAERYLAGDETGAQELDESLQDVYEVLNTLTTNPIPVKAAVRLLGFAVGGPRLPLVDASGMQLERIGSMLQRHGLMNGAEASLVR
jgi:4-hydroxy-tetrahydrodipicolinate synthase